MIYRNCCRFGTTVVPGIALADPANNGYLNYILAHVNALGAGFLFAFLLGTVFDRRKETAGMIEESTGNASRPIQIEEEDSIENVGEQKEGENQSLEQPSLPEEIAAFAFGEYIGFREDQGRGLRYFCLPDLYRAVG